MTIRVGMIGYQFMGKAHTHAYRDLPFYFGPSYQPILKAISGRNEKAVSQAAERLGYESYETDWQALLARNDIDVVDIVTPNHTHAEIAIAAAEAGKHIMCEKPLAMSVEEAERMAAAVEKHQVVHMLSHNYRFAPAVQYAKQLIANGQLGKIRHFRAQYLQDWLLDPQAPMAWRLRKEMTGSGALGDIGAHIIDLARFLVGDVTEVSSMMDTFVTQRPYEDSDAWGEVNVDDAVSFLARFDNGVPGVFEATRYAGGNRNGNRFEINGEKGSIRWDLEKLNQLEVYFADDELANQGFRTIHCTEDVHPYASAYWPAGHNIGYEHTFINLMTALFKGIQEGYAPSPNFYDGLQIQKVMAAVEQSAVEKRWIDVD